MLILSRRIGQRVRITTPAGYLWVTMHRGFASCRCDGDDGIEFVANRSSGVVRYQYGPDEVLIAFKARRRPHHNDMVGIQAPDGWLILREELIDQQPREERP